jgi:hypothetical protein
MNNFTQAVCQNCRSYRTVVVKKPFSPLGIVLGLTLVAVCIANSSPIALFIPCGFVVVITGLVFSREQRICGGCYKRWAQC